MNQSHALSARSLVAFLIVAAATANAAEQGVKHPVRPPEPTVDTTNVLFGGTVTEVTKSSISIWWLGDEKAKTFSVSETLAAGLIPMKPRVIVIPRQRVVPGGYYVPPSHMYRLTDVKVGDLISIGYAHLGTENICDHIRIQKRPGGLVPPLPEEAEKLLNPVEIIKAKFPGNEWYRYKGRPYIPYHERMNAYWDLEDKGIPYPEKFGRDRRFPVAPMPHPPRR